MFRFWVFPRHQYSWLLTASRTPARPCLSCTHTSVWLDTCNSLALTGLLPGNSSLAGVEGQPPAHHLRSLDDRPARESEEGKEADRRRPRVNSQRAQGRVPQAWGTEETRQSSAEPSQEPSGCRKVRGGQEARLSQATCRRPKGLKDTRLGSPASRQFTSRASGSASREGQVPEISLPLPASKVPSEPS